MLDPARRDAENAFWSQVRQSKTLQILSQAGREAFFPPGRHRDRLDTSEARLTRKYLAAKSSQDQFEVKPRPQERFPAETAVHGSLGLPDPMCNHSLIHQ